MRRFWSEEEDQILRKFVKAHGKQWNLIASKLPQRTPTQIAARWEKCLNPDLIKGPFTAEEDVLILQFVEKNGPHSWPNISKMIPNRSPKQCRERWFNHLNPDVLKSAWTYEEDSLIFEQYNIHGPKWSLISKAIPGRTDNAVKNRWHSSITKRIKVDSDGKKTLMHDNSKRNRNKQMEQLRPPPLVKPNSPKAEVISLEVQPSSMDLITNEAIETEESRNTLRTPFKPPPFIQIPLISPDSLGYDGFENKSIFSPFSPNNDSAINSFLKTNPFDLPISPTRLALDHLLSPIPATYSQF